MVSVDVFMHAGDQETFGLVTLEATASGMPVVACAAGRLGELMDEHVDYAVPRCAAGDFV